MLHPFWYILVVGLDGHRGPTDLGIFEEPMAIGGLQRLRFHCPSRKWIGRQDGVAFQVLVGDAGVDSSSAKALSSRLHPRCVGVPLNQPKRGVPTQKKRDLRGFEAENVKTYGKAQVVVVSIYQGKPFWGCHFYAISLPFRNGSVSKASLS